jgi:hypothetical protein
MFKAAYFNENDLLTIEFEGMIDAAQFPKEADRVILIDDFLPGIGDWKKLRMSSCW